MGLFNLFAVDLDNFNVGLSQKHVRTVDLAVEEAHAQRVLVEIVDLKLHGRVPFRVRRVDRVRGELLEAQVRLAKNALKEFNKRQTVF